MYKRQIKSVDVLRGKGYNVLDAPKGRGVEFHAERQLYGAGFNDIGISRQLGMCRACEDFFAGKPDVRVTPYRR